MYTYGINWGIENGSQTEASGTCRTPAFPQVQSLLPTGIPSYRGTYTMTDDMPEGFLQSSIGELRSNALPCVCELHISDFVRIMGV